VAPGLPEFSEKEKVHVAEEMADVLSYLIRLADRCQIGKDFIRFTSGT